MKSTVALGTMRKVGERERGGEGGGDMILDIDIRAFLKK
jgi:hypothetical protein